MTSQKRPGRREQANTLSDLRTEAQEDIWGRHCGGKEDGDGGGWGERGRWGAAGFKGGLAIAAALVCKTAKLDLLEKEWR
jgi:hypothetical protein